MGKQNIIDLIKKGESETLEFKETPKLDNEIGECISAFSNTKGGKILIGVSDFRKVIGVSIGKNTIEELANYIKRNTDPKIYPSIRVEEMEGKNIIKIEIKESSEKPVFFKKHAYKRVGKTSPEMSSSEIRKLAKETGEKVYWDELVCEEVSLEDINWNFIKEKFIPLYEKVCGKKVEGRPLDLLKSLGCIRKNKPTNAGLLLFGKEPQRFFKNSYIALARYPGKEVYGKKLDYKEFTGNLFQQIDSCNNYIVEHTVLMSRLIPGEVRRTDIPEYGRFSVRELITNAVCHRDYSDQGSKIIIKIFDDKIEFYNIGGLPKGITPENITSKQYSRNPTIAKVLAKVEYIEELGEGWDKIIKEHKEHPLKPKLPDIKSDGSSTLVVLFSTKEKFEEEKYILNERQKKIIKYLEDNERITRNICMELLKVSKDTAVRELSNLISKEIIERRGSSRGTYYIIKECDANATQMRRKI